MVNPQCSNCTTIMENYGALLFSPPENTVLGGTCNVTKMHLCVPCYNMILKVLRTD